MTLQSTAETIDVPTSATLDRIEEDIRRMFLRRVHDFHIEALDDGLVLHGRTKTFHGKQLIQHAVMKATEIPLAANNINVG